jgi:ATP-dependent DNA ligase
MSQCGDTIPPALRPPLEVALAKGVKGIPPASALPGQMLFEPKFDGYRVLIFRDRDRASLWSRQGKDLTRYSVGVKRRCADFGLMTVQFSVRDRCRTLA